MPKRPKEEKGESSLLHFVGFDIIGSFRQEKSSTDQLQEHYEFVTALRGCPTFSSRAKKVEIDTGDGAFVGFSDDIEAPFQLALELQEKMKRLRTSRKKGIQFRTGVHSGTVKEALGVDGRPNWSGEGIAGCARVMSFGKANHILLSNYVAEQLLKLSNKYAALLHLIGRRLDKNGREFVLHNAYGKGFGSKIDPTAPVVDECDPLTYYKSHAGEMLKTSSKTRLPYIPMWEKADGLGTEQVECTLGGQFEIDKALLDRLDTLKSWLESDREVGDSSVARLVDLSWTGGKLLLKFQESKYSYGLLTNFYLDIRLKGQRRLRDIIAPDPLAPLNNPGNKSSNHLGLNCIVETADGEIFLQKRSQRVAVYPGILGSSASGALDLRSGCIEAGKSKPPSPFRGITLEIVDELGIRPEEISLLKLLAICRELENGGKPTTFFVATTKLRASEVEERWRVGKPRGMWETEDLVFCSTNDTALSVLAGKEDVSGPAKANLFYYSLWKGSRAV